MRVILTHKRRIVVLRHNPLEYNRNLPTRPSSPTPPEEREPSPEPSIPVPVQYILAQEALANLRQHKVEVNRLLLEKEREVRRLQRRLARY